MAKNKLERAKQCSRETKTDVTHPPMLIGRFLVRKEKQYMRTHETERHIRESYYKYTPDIQTYPLSSVGQHFF